MGVSTGHGGGLGGQKGVQIHNPRPSVGWVQLGGEWIMETNAYKPDKETLSVLRDVDVRYQKGVTLRSLECPQLISWRSD